ncbi:MAG: hypothetical protein IT381_11595 [Deltaproteobacteria bacterium]|nr:hypothetical protein [Deltaproteobacteria bacterium]
MTQPLWAPLSIWRILLIFFVAQVIGNLSVVALREGAGLPVPQWVGGGLGGFFGVLAVFAIAKKRREGSPPR